MTVLEMHNAIRLGLNKINSNLYSDLLDEEIDLLLNTQQDILINQRYDSSLSPRHGFEVIRRRTEELRRITVYGYESNWYTTSQNNEFITPLPYDFLYYASSRTKLYYNNCADIDSTTNTSGSYVAVIELKMNDELDFSNFDIQHTGGNTTIFDRTNFADYAFPDDKEAFIRHMLDSVSDFRYEVYWEVFKNKYYPNSIIVVRTSGSSNVRYTVDGSTYTTTSFTGITYTTAATLDESPSITVPNREAQHDDINVLKQDPFNKPSFDEPLVTTDGQFLRLHTDGEFVPEKNFLTYVRKPHKISLSLQQDCELSEAIHPALVAAALSKAKADSESQTYNLAENERLKTE